MTGRRFSTAEQMRFLPRLASHLPRRMPYLPGLTLHLPGLTPYQPRLVAHLPRLASCQPGLKWHWSGQKRQKTGILPFLRGRMFEKRWFLESGRSFDNSPTARCWRRATGLVDERGNVIGIVSAKVLAHGHLASAALAASGALPENVNYAVKSSLLLSFLESVPDVANKLKVPNTVDEPFADVVKSAADAAVLVLVY